MFRFISLALVRLLRCLDGRCYSILSDLQMVNISLRVLSRPDAAQLPAIYRQLGIDYDERVLPSICNEVSLLTVYLVVLTFQEGLHIGQCNSPLVY